MFHLGHFLAHLFTFKVLAKISPITHLARLKIPAELASTMNVPEDTSMLKLLQSNITLFPKSTYSSSSHIPHFPPLHLFIFLVFFIAIVLYLSLHFSILITTLWIFVILSLLYLWMCKYYEPIYQENQSKIDQRTRYLDQMMETMWFYA